MTNTTLYDFQNGTYIPRSILPAHGVDKVSAVLRSHGYVINYTARDFVQATNGKCDVKVYGNGWISEGSK